MNSREKQKLSNEASVWVSKHWHKEHIWKAKTGKFIKRLFHKRMRHNTDYD